MATLAISSSGWRTVVSTGVLHSLMETNDTQILRNMKAGLVSCAQDTEG
jgi:hypothetical protein